MNVSATVLSRRTVWQAFLFTLFTLAISQLVLAKAADNGSEAAMPAHLYKGMIEFELNSGNYFQALVQMSDDYIKAHPINYARALWGFHIKGDVNEILARFPDKERKSKLSVQDQFYIGEMLYSQGECLESLKAFKPLKKKLSLDDKQKYAFYAANCFIKLGSDKRAAKVLTDILSGKWASYAYFNLAMSYASASRDKTKALVALRVAAELNGNKTPSEKALGDRIYLAAASLYLDSEKNQQALDFFKKVHLDSESSAQALYLNGLTHMELGDFRSANQSWLAAKKYPLVNAATAEAILAIPYAFERSGYVSQALEAYLEASSSFENELKIIDKIDQALEKYGAQKVLIDQNEIEGLEWFLANNIALNTTRASYYSYFMSDFDIYDTVELHSELEMLNQSIIYWDAQLDVFASALKDKKSNFSSNQKSFDSKAIRSKIDDFQVRYNNLKSSSGFSDKQKNSIQLVAMSNAIDTLNDRLALLSKKVKVGEKALDGYLSEIRELARRTKEYSSQIEKIKKLNDKALTDSLRERLSDLRVHMLSNYERAEQGLIHIFQGIAENKMRRKGNKSKGGAR